MNSPANRIGRTREQSVPSWPPHAHARPGAPNIVVVLMDDMGWSDPGCFGSEISTPHIDRLAAQGVRLTHYTTHAICSSARAALLTGCDSHRVGTGWLSNNHPGYPGYSGEIPLDAATLPETLRTAGYETIMVGKWHNTPVADTVSGGSKHNWPAQRGFDTFYGFMAGEVHHFFPARLMQDNQLLPIDAYPPGYYSGDDWMDQGIRFVKELRASRPAKPFFLYVANNAMHSPLHAKPEDIARYRGKYDRGWSVARAERLARQQAMGLVPPGTHLPASDPRVPAWENTDAANRALYARHMEVYAAMLDNADQNIGKLMLFLDELGERDNTIVLFTSDNGGTGDGGEHGSYNNNRMWAGAPALPINDERAMTELLGGPQSMPLYPTAWGEVSNTPFPTFKTHTGGGGRRVSFIATWPARLRGGGDVRREFMHVTDVMPTLLSLAGVAPLQTSHGQPALAMDGLDCSAMLLNGTPSPRREQHYELWSNRGFYRDGWFARSLQVRGTAINMDNWTLHHLDTDFSESTDVAAQHPEKLRELQQAFDDAAWRQQVYPLDNRKLLGPTGRFADLPDWLRTLFDTPRRFLPGAQTAHRYDVIPLVEDRSFRIRCEFVHGGAIDAGVLWALGDISGGIVLCVEDARLHLHYNAFGTAIDLPAVSLQEGRHLVIFDYEALGARRGRGRLQLDGVTPTEWIDMSPTMAFGPLEGFDVGLDRRAPVSWQIYERHGTFPYRGTIREVWIEPGLRPTA